MAAKRAASKLGTAPPMVQPVPEPLRREDILELVQAGFDRSLAALQDGTKGVEQRLDALRGELSTGVLADVMALIAEADAPEQSPLQRRAQAIQVELTLRRQEVAIEEWRRKFAASGAEMERQRQLFARLEADFERRAAAGEQAARAADETAAALQRALVERDAAVAVLAEALQALAQTQETATETQRALTEVAAGEAQARELVDQLTQERDADRQTILALQQEGLQAARERDRLQQECTRLQQEKAELAAGRDADHLALQTLQDALDQCRQENGDLAERLGLAQAELASGAVVLTESERRVEELRSSRWRQIGVGLGLAKRATFEK